MEIDIGAATSVHFRVAQTKDSGELGPQIQLLISYGSLAHMQEAAARLQKEHHGPLLFKAQRAGVLCVHSPDETAPLLSVSVDSLGLNEMTVPVLDGQNQRGYSDIPFGTANHNLHDKVGDILASIAMTMPDSDNMFAHIARFMAGQIQRDADSPSPRGRAPLGAC